MKFRGSWCMTTRFLRRLVGFGSTAFSVARWMNKRGKPMRILFLTTAHNSLSQRLWIELRERGHDLRVAVVATPESMIAAIAPEAPDLIIAPMLKIAIPREVWSRHLCLIVHPGIKGDRGPSSLDWAIAEEEPSWGVSVLEAAPEFDAGPLWATREFVVPGAATTKSRLYRGAVTEAAVAAVLEAVARIELREFHSGAWKPETVLHGSASVRGRLRPPMRQADRHIDWMRDEVATIVRKIRAADSAPGVLGTIYGRSCFLYGAHEEDRISGPAGMVLAKRDGAICIGTIDGAVWISHLKVKNDLDPKTCSLVSTGAGCERCEADQCAIAGVKLPATQVLGSLLVDVPEMKLPIDDLHDYRTFREITYTEEDDIGYLAFDFYNGAMSTSQCIRLRDAFLYARTRPTRAIVLLGGRDFWSNGIHLGTIEASADPAMESWRNINAIDDFVLEVLDTRSHLVVAGMRGNAGAGGAMLALAADCVFARAGIVLNPHYRTMGGLYGSEYWTYTLPRRVGQNRALELTSSCRPIGTREARRIGFIDDCFGEDIESFEAELKARVKHLVDDSTFETMLQNKQKTRLADEWTKPLSLYRADELEHMKVNFFGPDPAYHEARRCFVFKGNPPPRESRTPARVGFERAAHLPEAMRA